MKRISTITFRIAALAIACIPAVGNCRAYQAGLSYHILPKHSVSNLLSINGKTNRLTNTHPLSFAELNFGLNDTFKDHGWAQGAGLIFGSSHTRDLAVDVGDSSIAGSLTLDSQESSVRGFRFLAANNLAPFYEAKSTRANPFFSLSLGFMEVDSKTKASEAGSNARTYRIDTISRYFIAKTGLGARIINSRNFFTKVEVYGMYQRPYSTKSTSQINSGSSLASSKSGPEGAVEDSFSYGAALYAGGHF